MFKVEGGSYDTVGELLGDATAEKVSDNNSIISSTTT